MCGICGMMGHIDAVVLERMTAALAHRGPDDSGVWVDAEQGIALGHTRLAIIDLSPGGRQPMTYARGRLLVVFNGEIYNYREIKAELEKYGCTFTTTSDTEVLLAAYDNWGTGCLNRLRGMFAFAIFNTKLDDTHPRLFLARDRFGQRPLYYSVQGKTFLFASEIGALLNSGQVERRVERQALWDFLSLGAVTPPPTLVQNVFALLPGCAMTVDTVLQINTWQYWDLAQASQQHFADASKLSFGEAAEQVRALLEEATRLHMVSDVKVGAFLSGGIDSSIVIALMSQYVLDPIHTCTVGFENQFSALDETTWARKLASHFGTRHTELILTGQDVAAEYDHLVQSIDQPSYDGTNTYFVSRLARQEVKVSLSGLGGDELYAGYLHFGWLEKADRQSRRIPPWARPALAWAAASAPDRVNRHLPMLLLNRVSRHARLRRFTTEHEKRRMANPAWGAENKRRSLENYYRTLVHEELDPISCTSYVEACGYMRHTLLRDVDAMSMAHALEVRPVLLDHVLAEFAFALPPEYKLHEGRSKRVLIEATRGLIPPEILARPKIGFGMPLFEWLCGPLAKRARTAFESSTAERVFTASFRQHALDVLKTDGPEELRLWAYVMLLEWLQYEHVDV